MKCKTVISPCFAYVKAPLNRAWRLTQMKPKAGFHFEPRNKLPSFADHSRIKLVVDPEVRPAYISPPSKDRNRVEAPSSLSVDLPHFFPKLECFFSMLPSFLADLFLDGLFLLGMYVIDLLRLD